MRGNMTKTLRTHRHKALIDAIREARRVAGMSQRELAAKLGMPQSCVAAIEKGERRVDVVEFLELCAALSVPPLELLAIVLLRR